MSCAVEAAVGNLERMGWTVLRAGDLAEAGELLQGLIGEDQRAVSHRSSLGEILDLPQILGHRFVPEATREAILAADFGITGATAVVAETGSVMIAEQDGAGRLVSNLPYSHIVLATADEVVPTLDHALTRAGRPAPRYISFITGPSKTGDIEFEIVTGMHGPRHVWLILLDPPTGN